MNEEFARLRLLAPDEAVDLRRAEEFTFVDHCNRCEREFIVHMVIRHYCGCAIKNPKPATTSPWWKRLLSPFL